METRTANGIGLVIENNDIPSESNLYRLIMLTNELIWKSEFEKKDVEDWLSNFKGDVFDASTERRLALWLLANFVYYNMSEVRHLCRVMLKVYLRRTISEEYQGVDSSINELRKFILSETVFCHLGRVSESGELLSYFFREATNMPVGKFSSKLADVPANAKRIVFIDDVSIDGTQAAWYLSKEMTAAKRREGISLMTLISTREAADQLAPIGIRIDSAILLDERSRCFSDSSDAFRQCRSRLDECQNLAEHYGSRLRIAEPLGHANGGYAFGFFYNTPDNSLPIFSASTGGWKPIMPRFDKKYGTSLRKAFEEDEKYV